MVEAAVGSVTQADKEVSDSSVDPTKTPSKDVVSYDTHRRLLDEKKKTQAERDQLLAEKKQREEEEAKKRGDYEALLKSRDEALAKAQADLASVRETQAKARKLAAVLDSIEGEVEPKWFSLIDVSSVVTNPDTGEIDQMSVTKVVEGLRKTWPEMIKNPNAPRLPADAPKGNGAGKISKEEWLKLPAKEMRVWKPDQIIGL